MLHVFLVTYTRMPGKPHANGAMTAPFRLVEVAGVEPASKKHEVEVHPQAWSVFRSLCRGNGQP